MNLEGVEEHERQILQEVYDTSLKVNEFVSTLNVSEVVGLVSLLELAMFRLRDRLTKEGKLILHTITNALLEAETTRLKRKNSDSTGT